jgi:hypothetical protein
MAEKKIKSATKRDPKLSVEENFAVSPFKVAYDVLGKQFLSMPEEARNFVMKMVASGDLTATEIRKASKNLLPYNPDKGISSDTVLDDEAKKPVARADDFKILQQNMDMRELENRLREEGRGYDSRSINTMSDEEFYRTFFGYDYQQKQIPQTDAERDFFKFDPQYEDNLPKGPIEGNKMFKYQDAFFPDGRRMKAAEGGTMTDPIYDPNALFGATSTQTNPDADNAPFTQVYGQRRSSPLSMEEYLSGSMYDFAGIDVSAAPDIDDDDDDDDDDAQAAPNILTPVSERTDDPSQVFRAISQGGQLGTGYRVSAKDPSKYLDDLVNAETFTVKEDGFSKYAQQKFKEGGGMVTAAVTPALGPVTVLAAGAAALAQKQNKKNAQAILQTGGGDLFELNGATVSRAPGERIFTGNLGGFSQEQLYASREMDFGFIPGSMREMVAASTDPYAVQGKKDLMKRSGNRGVAAAGQVSGHIMDAYGTIHGTRDESGGQMQVGAIAAQRMRENEFRQNMIDAGLQSKLDEMIADNSFTMNAVRAKQHADGIMKAGQGFRFRAANVPADQYAKALNDRGKTYQDYVKSTHGTTPTTKVDTSQPDDFVPSVSQSRSEANRLKAEAQAAAIAAARQRDESDDRDDFAAAREDAQREREERNREREERNREKVDRANEAMGRDRGFRGFNDGGRIGMARGDTPQGTFEPGFVEGPPENFTERETVADDQNGKVKPDTFIINAAAVEIAGSEDIRKMLMKAYEVAVQKGLDIGRVDRKIYEGTVDVALSKGEVVVPPELAKIIGYDRLRKINNRGKKEVASRQKKAAKGGFISK